ncbi:hypothetical protein CHU92_07810 [Flavobacterium cyanobacteriorum]|uniref:Uncharacterized protein n=1 Tax=Flavobacterium cyanobacteriorum TaxID=2022802 RepID=A0A255Z9T3_9FLAO|nr:TonB-dependent receptor [Flavobacterium cyanobacteriorum]OYQ37654.1 hypothetical protein CHU92_07810 [Flavobacterium cyanobacteriorum]
MIISTKNFSLLLLFCFILVPVYGQDEYKNTELKEVLSSLETLHNIRFSYLDNDIQDVKIIAPDKNLPLKVKLRYIENRTGLSYKESGARYIILYRETGQSVRSLCGYVLDENNLPLENASITFDNEKVTYTGADGYFELPYPQTGNIVVELVGFESKIFTAKSFNGDCKAITLNGGIRILDEVIAERYLTSGITKKNGVFSIKPKKFGILPGLIEPDVLSTMQQLPGIGSIDETLSNINVRGGTHDQNLFLWNDIRLFQTGHFFGLISALNPNPAYTIKILKNGTSAYYGESVSSVIDISSRSETIPDNATSIGSNMINADFYTRLKVSSTANVEVSARRSFTDVIELPTYSKYSKRIFQNTVVTQLNNSADVNYRSDKEFYFYDFTGQYQQKIGRNNLYMNFIGIKNKLDFTEGFLVARSISSLNQLTLGGSIAWHTRWDEYNTSQVSFYNSYYSLESENFNDNNNSDLKQDNIVNDKGLRLSHTIIINPGLSLKSGYQFNQTSIENSELVNRLFLDGLKTVLRTHALLAEMDYISANEVVAATFGIRGNYIEQFHKFLPEPRMQFTYKISNTWRLEALGEIKSQTVSQAVELQDDFLGLEKRRWVQANNRDIPVQKSAQVSAGLSFKDKGWLFSLEHFYKNVDGITTSGQAFQDQLETVLATGNYSVQGTEILVQKEFKGFYAWLSYTWNNNNYKFDDFSPYKFPSNFEIAHTLNSAAIYEVYNFKIAFGARWFTGRPVTTPVSVQPATDGMGNNVILYGDPNADNIENFFQMNFSATYTWKFQKKTTLQLGVSVLNLFNRQNIINRYYRYNTDAQAIEVVNTYSVERTPNALIKLSF